MSKGTAAQGLKSRGKSHIYCRRCGNRAYHMRHHACSSCGYGKSAKLRSYSWKKINK